MSSMLRFQTVGLKTVLLKLCVSIYAMIMFRFDLHSFDQNILSFENSLF